MKPATLTWRRTGAFAVFAGTLIAIGCMSGGGSLGYGRSFNDDPRSIATDCVMVTYAAADAATGPLAELESLLAKAAADSRTLTASEFTHAGRLIRQPDLPENTELLHFPSITVQHEESGTLTTTTTSERRSRSVTMTVTPHVLKNDVLRVGIAIAENTREPGVADNTWEFGTVFTAASGAVHAGQQIGLGNDPDSQRSVLLIRPRLIKNGG